MQSDSHSSLRDAEAGDRPMELVSVWDGRETVIALPFAAVGLLASYFINTTYGLRGGMAILGLLGPQLVALVFLFVFLALFVRWKSVQVRDGVMVLGRRDGRGLTLEMDRIIAIESDPDRLLARLPGKGMPIHVHTDQGVLRMWASVDVQEQLREVVLQVRPDVIDFYGRADMRLPPPPDHHQRMWLDEYTQKIHRLLQHANGRAVVVIGVGLFVAGGVFAAALVAVLQGMPAAEAFNRFVLTLIIAAGFMAAVKAVQLWRNTRRCRTFQLQLQKAAGDPSCAVTTTEGQIWLYRHEERPEAVSQVGKGFCIMGLLLGCVPVVGLGLSLMALYHTWVYDHGPWRFLAWLGTAIGLFSTSFLITHVVLAVL